MMVGMEEDARMAAAAAPGSECSSGCQSGWTTYLDDDRSSYSYTYTYDTARLHGLSPQPCYGYGCDYSEEEAEEDDLSMVSDASSGPRQQHSAGSDEGAAAALANANARAARRGSRTAEPAGARRQSKMAAVASTLLEDTASSPAFFKHAKVLSSPEGSGYGGAAGSMMGMGSAADFSCAFLATTGYEFESPLNAPASHLGGYLQVQYPAAAVKPMPTRQVCRDGGDTIQRW
uniref:Uncharacterized protein n=1 Tax=Avena sativa TaxID=4498 RepID=A0ACD5XM84_AVESA